MSMDWKRIEFSQIDTSVTARISEEDVVMWLAARMMELRTELPRLNNIGVEVSVSEHVRNDEHLYAKFDVHGYNAMGGYSPTLQDAVIDLRLTAANNPDQQAGKMRERAARLTRKASELDALANDLRTKPLPGAVEGGAQ